MMRSINTTSSASDSINRIYCQFKLVLWKSVIIRKRHIFLTIVEIALPILLFLVIAYGRSKIVGLTKSTVTHSTYNEPKSSDLLYSQYFSYGDTQILYTPYRDWTEKLIRKTQLKLNIPSDAVKPFDTETQLIDYYMSHSNLTTIAIVFDPNGDNNQPKQLSYDLRFHKKYLSWNTNQLFRSSFMYSPDSGSEKYLQNGFVALQIALDLSFIELSMNADKLPIDVMIEEFPYPPHTNDAGLNDIFMHFLPIITIFSFIFLCPAVLKRVSDEKHSGIKELLKIVGMRPWMLWLGWFCHALITNIISIVCIVILMKVPLWGSPYPPIEYCNYGVFAVFLLLYCIASITFCFMISSLFTTPTNALAFGATTWILSYFLPRHTIDLFISVRWGFKMMVCLLPNMAVQYGYSAISFYEMAEIGVNWSNLFESAGGGSEDITMGHIFIILSIDAIIFFLITLYVDAIRPGLYGISKPIVYPIISFQRTILIGFKSTINAITNLFSTTTRVNSLTESESTNLKQQHKQQDDDSSGNKNDVIDATIVINNLQKKYGSNMAVVDLSLKIYPNRITVLLGHNGAGKTTTMSMMTGMINASSGTITINGYNINDDIDTVRNIMGFCPQHNLLFPDMTVYEHLGFFAKLKGSSNSESDEEIKYLLKILNLEAKSNKLASTLSGGMKRKLCLAMAVVGNSNVLILDEPTSGMDPESRRELWNLLLEWRHTKTIVISTHFMEEADALGDSIVIMAKGCLQNVGTPMDLKRIYETGCHLSLILQSDYNDVDNLTKLIRSKLPTATLGRQDGRNVNYCLPTDDKKLIADLIETIEKQNDSISHISITQTTLEDVFLKAKLASETSTVVSPTNNIITNVKSVEAAGTTTVETPNKSSVDEEDSHQTSKIQVNNADKFNSCNNIKSQLSSLLLKRWWFFKANYTIYIILVLITIALFFLTFYLSENTGSYYGQSDQKLAMNLNIYGKTGVYFGYGGVRKDQQQQQHEKKQPLFSNSSKFKNYYKEVVQSEQGDPIEVNNIYEALINDGIKNMAYYKQHLIAGARFDLIDNQTTLIAMYSNNAYHGAPISINLLMNAIIKTLLADNNYQIIMSNAPLQEIDMNSSPHTRSEVEVAILWTFLIPFAMLFLMSLYLYFPNMELSLKFTQLQFCIGIKPKWYWFCNWLFDLCVNTFTIIVILFVVYLVSIPMKMETFTGINEYSCLFIILFSYSFSAIPIVYLFSYYTKTIIGGVASMHMFSLFIGLIPTIIVSAMAMSGDTFYEQQSIYIEHLLRIICPQFGLTYSLMKFTRLIVQNHNWRVMETNRKMAYCSSNGMMGTAKGRFNPCCRDGGITLECQNHQSYYVSSELGVYPDVIEMLIPGLIYFFIFVLMQTPSFQEKLNHLKYFCLKLFGKVKYDHLDISLSTRDENNGKGKYYANHLMKYYGTNKVVENVTFNVENGECFGLLGVNGAGKSTTFRMLTRDTCLNQGEIGIKNGKTPIRITDDMYSERLSYCPQYDALNLDLTGKELLQFMALIRGYSNLTSHLIADKYIKSFDLTSYASNPCRTYSGGNKRKLNLAMALIGNQQVILLDEPTSGVDPASRRSIWNTLAQLKNEQKSSIVLTSHSMDECETLCDHIAIMKAGNIEANDTIPNLKRRYQTGYTVLLKLKSTISKKPKEIVAGVDCVDGGGLIVIDDDDDNNMKSSSSLLLDNLKRDFNGKFKDCHLKDEHSGLLHYLIKRVRDELEQQRLSYVFNAIEQLKDTYNGFIEDYTVSETTLEDVFLSVAKNDDNHDQTV